MLNKLRLLVINVRKRTVLFMVCKYILFFIHVKVAPTVREQWPKTKQSEDQLLALSTVYATCNYHTIIALSDPLDYLPHSPNPMCSYWKTIR